jgi:hypothetical protein
VFSYNATTNSYSVSGNGISSTFGPADFAGVDEAGDQSFSRAIDGGGERLTLLNPQRLGSGTRNVSLGLWQRRTNGTDFRVDVFSYGFPTPATEVPRVGSATYDIDLFGVASPIGTFPRSVIGDGTFSLDFAQGLFEMSGEAGEYNNDVDYSTCCGAWRGAGYMASGGGLNGYFIYNGRTGITYRASILGALYGPAGAEVGASLLGNDGPDWSFTGGFAGTRARAGIDVNLSVLESGERSYRSHHGFFIASQRPGGTSESGGSYFPAAFGRVDFGADGSITPTLGINDPGFTNVTFRPTDRVAAQSDNRFDVYEVRNANGAYRLEMFRPGPGNPDITLTYSSFGQWREDRATASSERQSISTWLSYGARTIGGSLPPTGSARFNATILGSGERLTDMARLTVRGTSTIDIDFAAATISGSFKADAWTLSNEKISLPDMTFTASRNVYSFDTALLLSEDRSDGSIRGSLYGPGGEEIGGAFEFFTRQNGRPDAIYSGAFYGKRE